MARAKPLQPAGELEGALLEAVDERYPNRMDFFRRVAQETGKQVTTEKSHFNRIVKGHIGDQTTFRLKLYAAIIGRSGVDFLRPSERAAEEALEYDRLPRPNLRSLQDDLAALTLRVDELARLVTHLASGGQSGTRTEDLL